MSEEKATYEGYANLKGATAIRRDSADIAQALIEAEKGFTDPFGIAQAFADQLEVSLKSMHPVQATKAACHAVQQYVESHDFIDLGHKGSRTPEYVKVPKKASKNPGGR